MIDPRHQPSRRPVWNPAIEWLEAQAVQDLQLKKLRRQLSRVYAESAYYRAKFDHAGVAPGDVRTLRDFERFPFFDKEEERLSQAESGARAGHCLGMHITCALERVNRISSTSGTTGSPTFTGFTRADRDVQAENMARALFRIGVVPGDTVLHASVLSMWIAGIPLCDAVMSYGACLVPLGALSGTERFAQIAREVRPKVAMLTPSYAEHLVRSLPERSNMRCAELGIEKLIVYGEPGGSIDEVRRRLEEGFGGARVYDLMGATGCHSPTGVSCEEHSGLHFFARDSCYFEVIDPVTLEPLPLEDGVEGEAVYTGLDKECGPLLRWRDKDLVRILTAPCKCGLPGFRYFIRGRADDMLLVKGVNVFPNAVRDVVLQFEPDVTGVIRIVKPSSSPVIAPPVELKVELASGRAAAGMHELPERISERIHQVLRFRTNVQLFEFGELDQQFGQTHKAQLIERSDSRMTGGVP